MGRRSLEIGVGKQTDEGRIQQFCPSDAIQTDFLPVNYVDVSESDSGVKVGFILFLQCFGNQIHRRTEILPTFVVIVGESDKTLGQIDVFFFVFRCEPVIWPF